MSKPKEGYTQILTQISEILSKASLEEKNRNIQPTLLYSEGWLLRLILLWLSDNNINDFKLNFLKDSRWYSEAMLPSPFLANVEYGRGDKLAEKHTHCDGVIGNFEIGDSGKSDLKLLENCKQFIVIEAKIFSKLSPIKNAPGYNQVARTLACMSCVVDKSKVDLNKIESLGFFLLLPDSLPEDKINEFKKYTEKESKENNKEKNKNIFNTVENRVKQYEGRDDYDAKRKWFDNSFKPFLEKVQIDILMWKKDIIEVIKKHDSEYGEAIEDFYNKCLEFNKNKK